MGVLKEGALPDNVIKAGKAEVKSHFSTVALYFAATGLIKGIFAELGRGISHIGKTVGGDTGEGIGSAISAVIQVMVDYMCDCCLGWVFYRKNKNAGEATLGIKSGASVPSGNDSPFDAAIPFVGLAGAIAFVMANRKKKSAVR